MSTPAPKYSDPQEYRDLNRRMADAILGAEPAPYRNGGYVRRIVDVRGRRSGQVHAVPIAVVTLDDFRFLVSPTRKRNWVRNLVADPACVLRSRDALEPCTATLLDNADRIADVVFTYLAQMNAPWAVAQFPFPADATRPEIAAAAAHVAVFQLDPVHRESEEETGESGEELAPKTSTSEADTMPLTVQPVDESLFGDVQTVLGVRGQPARCQCQGYRMGWHAVHSADVEGRRQLLCDQVMEGHGLVAHLDGEPVGWCSLAPRRDYTFLRKTTWHGRDEDKDDPGVWAVTCFVTRAGFRRRGVSRALVGGTIELARDRGARALEAYPMRPAPGKDVTWGEMHVGALSSFLDAGFRVVHVPSLRRAIVRYDY